MEYKEKKEETREKKREQALLELFKSEKDYTYDLILWTRTFKHLVVNTPTLALYTKHIFITNILMNSEDILKVHNGILDAMMEKLGVPRDVSKEDFLELDVTEQQMQEICEVYIKSKQDMLKEYSSYAGRVPKASEDIEKILRENSQFNQEVIDVLRRINRLHLGCPHFIMRPMQKITRYALLFDAIAKHARGGEKDALVKASREFSEISSQVNKNVEYSSNYFALFHLRQMIDVDSQDKKISIGMMQKERKLVRLEEEVNLVMGSMRKLVSIAILDNCVFLIESLIRDENIQIGLYKKKLLNDYMPVEDLAVEKISEESAMEECLLKLSTDRNSYVISCPDWIREGIFQDVTAIIKTARDQFVEIGVETLDLETKGKDVSLQFIEEKEIEEMGIFSIGDFLIGSTAGLEIVQSTGRTVIHDKPVQEVEYSQDLGCAFFLKAHKVYYIRIAQEGIDTKITRLTDKIAVSFLTKTKLASSETEENFLIIKRIGYLGTEELLIYKIDWVQGKGLVKEVYRKMYMAGDINSVSFFGNHFAIASNDFELIDLQDLTTQELLDPLDKTIGFFVDKLKSKPISIKKTEENRYLVIFNDLGLYINRFGSRRNTSVLFLWLMCISYAEVFGEYVAVAGVEQVKFFTLADGVLRGVLNITNGKFLPHSKYLLVYNDKYLYKITLAPLTDTGSNTTPNTITITTPSTNTDTDSGAKSGTDNEAKSGTDTDTDTNSNPSTDTNTDTDSGTNTNPNPSTDTDTNTNQTPNTTPSTTPNTNTTPSTDTNTTPSTDTDTDTNQTPNTTPSTNTDTDTTPNTNTTPSTDTNTTPSTNTNTNTTPNTNRITKNG
ncbi:hypothetical protein NECID01_0122 [Nematocida sp. AWRm77]|nr:hypothetical protein NECID01_0122 [Nematocida sp. AWRm77]